MKMPYRILVGAVIVVGAAYFLRSLIGTSTVALWSPQGPIAQQEHDLIKTIIFLILLIIIPTMITVLTFAWKYRAGNPRKEKYDPDYTHSPWAEIILWIIPATMIFILSVITWNTVHALDPYKSLVSSNRPVAIKVVALRWKWLFIYPEQNIATVNFVEFPERTPVHFELTADAPMSSFWIPQLGTQIYAMAAMQTQLNVMANSEGEYAGKNMEINGAGYADMNFKAKSVSRDDFDAWIQHVKQASSTLDQVAYEDLAKPTEANPVAYYSSVTQGLYDSIMMKFMMPGNMQGMKM